MRTNSLPGAALLLLAALLLSACAGTPKADDEAAPADADTASAAASDAADAEADEATEGKQPEGDAKAAAAAKAGDKPANGKAKEEEKDEDEEKKDKAQKKWDEAVKDLTEATGLFKTWRDDQKLLLELDEKALGRQFLYYAALNSGLGSFGAYRGAMLDDTPFPLHFERRGEKKIVLVSENVRYFEGNDAREERVLAETISEGYLKGFDIVAELEDPDRILIDLGSWFAADNLKLAEGFPGKFGVAKDLNLFTDVKSFPRNVEIYQEMILTGKSLYDGNSTFADGRGAALQVQHSLVALPEPGYKPREFDQRVGYFYTERKDIFDRTSGEPVTRYIDRWRLVKKDPSADVSDPIKPIVYWIENSTPKAFRQSVREGIEAWEPAFRKAGFSNAILAKQMPEDAEWDPADINYAVVRWSEDENLGFAIGPHRADPRTGEVIDADITMQASFLNTYAERFDTWLAKSMTKSKQEILDDFLKSEEPVSFVDPNQFRRCEMMGEERAFQVAIATMLLPLLDSDTTQEEFLQAMIREVTAHEVGHTLGLRHNFKSSFWRSMDELADAEDTSLNGICGSFMDYPAVNMAAPDSTQGEFFQSAVGPYDKWAIEYGYKEFGSNEETHLNKIAARSYEIGLEYGTDEDSFIGDPFTVVWDMGADPIAFAESQIALADWGLDHMLERGAEDGDGYYKYSRYYALFNSLASRSWGGLARFVGGFSYNRDMIGQENGRPPIVAVDPDVQKRALDVIVEEGIKFEGKIPDDQRLLMANKKYGSFGSWFEFWSMVPVTQLVNSTRYFAMLPVMSPTMYERVSNQHQLTDGASLSMRDVAYKVFEAVWPEEPSEYDMWAQSDYVDLVIMGLSRDSTPMVTALFDEMLRRSATMLDSYEGSSEPIVAAHGVWLGDRIRRYRERQALAFD